jgi:hypothetical protein
MKKVYTSFILLIIMLLGTMSMAQEGQKRYINYQGVARKADGTLMAGESLAIGIGLKFGSSSSETLYEESHNLTADANGVFSLLIGNGNTLSGDYQSLPWGGFATFASVSMNGNPIGTTELMAVPHALSSADNQWHTMGDDIENKNGGNVFVTGSLYASRDLSLAEGAAVNEFSTDITLGSNSDEIVPTQKAIKTYVDSQLGESGGGTDDQTAAEVSYDNSTSGLTATTTQSAIDELVTGGSVDADSDPNNEIQTLSFNGTTSELSLTDGGSVILPSGGTDADADPSNEIQDISLSGTELTISDGSTIDLAPIVPPGGTDDQNLILAGDVLSIEDGSGSVDLSTYVDDADADPTNELQDISLSGTELTISDGSTIDFSSILPSGSSDNQELTFNDVTNILEIEDGNTVDLSSLAGGGSPWSAGPMNAIYYNAGNVGIGTTAPNNEHHVHSSTGAASTLYTIDGYGDDATDGLSVGVANGLGAAVGFVSLSEDGPLNLQTNNLTRMSIRGDGQVGIGTQTPTSELDVDGGIRSRDLSGSGQRNVVADANGNLIIGAGGGGSSLWTDNGGDIYYNSGKVGIGTNSPESSMAIETDGNQWDLSSTEGDFRIGDATHRLKMGVATAGAGAGDARIRVEGGTDRMMLGGGTNDVLTITDQNVGIGTITPAAKLHVNGNIRSNDLSGAGDRNVMADANGNLIIGAGGGGSSTWSENGNKIFYNDGHVGIGTNDPSVPLEINTSNSRQLVLKSTANDNYMQYITPSGFIGYSGVWSGNNDVDFGTTSGNTTGKVHLTTGATPKLTVASNGNVGIGTTSPTSKLEVDGNIKTSGELHGPGTGNANMVPIAYGTVMSNGTIATGSGNYSVLKTSNGKYRITISGENYVYFNYTAVATLTTGPGFIDTGSVSGTLTVDTYDTSGTPTDGIFTFVAYKP